VLGVHDVYQGSADAALRKAVQVPVKKIRDTAERMGVTRPPS
jgi:hypothetical protein